MCAVSPKSVLTGKLLCMVCAGLMENCRACATKSLNFLQELKSKVSIKGADPTYVHAVIQKILQIAQVRQNIHHNKLKNTYNEGEIFCF